jgi:putative ABC transport system permease protein
VEQTTRYFGADVNLDFARNYRVEKVTRQALEIAGVERVEVWTATGAELVQADGSPPEPVAVIAPPADSQLVEPKLLQGRWLRPGDKNVVAVNEAFWNDYPELQVGDSSLRLKVNGREEDWAVVGVFQYTGVDDLVAYANYDYLAKVLKEKNRASAYRLVTSQHSLGFQEQVSQELDTHFRDLGFQISQTEAGKAHAASVTDLLGIVTVVLMVMALMTALVGSIGLAGTMSMNVMERTREIGVMRAIGAHNQLISRLVIVEGLLVGLISFVLGAVFSFPISLLLSNAISMTIFNAPAEFNFTPYGFLIWLGVVVGLSLAASLLPARSASRLTIREVLAYE